MFIQKYIKTLWSKSVLDHETLKGSLSSQHRAQTHITKTQLPPGRILPIRASISQKAFSSSFVTRRRYPATKFIPWRQTKPVRVSHGSCRSRCSYTAAVFKRSVFDVYLAVAHSWIVSTVGQQHVVQGFLQTGAGGSAEVDVIWKCSVQVWKKRQGFISTVSAPCGCADSVSN